MGFFASLCSSKIINQIFKMSGQQTGSAASCPFDAISQMGAVFSFIW